MDIKTYSFKDFIATLAGVGGVINLGAGSASSEEGITIASVEDKNIMTIGADGQGQHSLVASDAKLVTVSFLKTSQTNKQLMVMYNLQKTSAKFWGTNIITLTDLGLNDVGVLRGVAFKKFPDINYQKEAGMVQWTFDAIAGDMM